MAYEMDQGLAALVGAAMGSSAPALDMRSAPAPSYAMGGAIGPGGQPQMGGQPQVAGVSPNMSQAPIGLQAMQQQIAMIQQQNPQAIEKVKQAMLQVMQTGELTQEELNTIVQLATAVAQNPELYPQIRAFAIREQLATEQDLPQEYDQGMVFTILVAAKAVLEGGGAPQSDAQPAVASMATGGETPTSKNADGSVKINAHEGEYVIPAHVVRAKGTEFFDKMLSGYNGENA